MSKSISSSKATLSSIKTSDTKEPSLDNPVYKVKQLINGTINTIYVFNGKKSEENEELFKKVFTEEERQQIKSDKITIKFSDQQIHFDDSIGTIKIKILNELKKEIVLDEIYLYCQKNETLNAVSVYQSLTQNNKLQLTKVRLDQFLSNIVSDESGKPFEDPPEKEVYTFETKDKKTKTKVPYIGVSLADVIQYILMPGPRDINELTNNIISYLRINKGGEPAVDKFFAGVEPLGWSYHGSGKIVDINGNPIKNATVRNIISISQNENYYCQESIYSNDQGEFNLWRLYPNNSLMRVYFNNHLDSADFPLEIEWTKPTHEAIDLGTLKINKKLSLLRTVFYFEKIIIYSVIANHLSSILLIVPSAFISFKVLSILVIKLLFPKLVGIPTKPSLIGGQAIFKSELALITPETAS